MPTNWESCFGGPTCKCSTVKLSCIQHRSDKNSTWIKGLLPLSSPSLQKQYVTSLDSRESHIRLLDKNDSRLCSYSNQLSSWKERERERERERNPPTKRCHHFPICRPPPHDIAKWSPRSRSRRRRGNTQQPFSRIKWREGARQKKTRVIIRRSRQEKICVVFLSLHPLHAFARKEEEEEEEEEEGKTLVTKPPLPSIETNLSTDFYFASKIGETFERVDSFKETRKKPCTSWKLFHNFIAPFLPPSLPSQSLATAIQPLNSQNYYSRRSVFFGT